MASTIDSISHGRFGVNIVSGWAKDEYEQMGLWPGEAYFGYRYDYSTEFVTVMKELLGDRHVRLQGQVLPDVGLQAEPSSKGTDQDRQRRPEPARHGVRRDLLQLQLHPGQGRTRRPPMRRPTSWMVVEAVAKTGRDVGNYVLMMVIADETDEKAMAKWKLYNEGADMGAMAWMSGQADADPNAAEGGTAKAISAPEGAINFNMGTLVGSYASVARMLDECATVPGTKGIMLTFDDFLAGMDQFGQHIQPLISAAATARPRSPLSVFPGEVELCSSPFKWGGGGVLRRRRGHKHRTAHDPIAPYGALPHLNGEAVRRDDLRIQ